MHYATRIVLSALFGYGLGFLLKRPGLGLIVGTLVGAMIPVDRYLTNPFTYLLLGPLLFAVLSPAFFGILTLVLLAPILLSYNLFTPKNSDREHWNIFDLLGDQSPNRTMMRLLAGFVKESPASRDRQFQLVKEFIQRTTLGFSRETLWEEYKKAFETDLDVQDLANELKDYTNRGQQKYFLQILIGLGQVDGSLEDSEKQYVRTVGSHLDLSDDEIEALIDRSGRDRRRSRRSRYRSSQNGFGRSTGIGNINEAYRILDVDPSASQEDVKAAYQRKVKEHHPDQYKGKDSDRAEKAEQKMAEINEAYEAIKSRW